MIAAVLGRDAEVAAWVAGHPPFDPARGFGNCRAIGWADGERLVAGTVFNNYDPAAGLIELSTAAESPRWLSRQTLRTMFGYVFDQLGCQLAVMRVSERNERMCAIARRFGFVGHHIPRLRGRDEGEFVFTLTEETWREVERRLGSPRQSV